MDVNCATTRRKTKHVKLCPKEEKNASLKKVSLILQKNENDRTLEEQQTLTEYSEVVEDLKMRWHRRDEAKRRLEEIEEPLDVIEEKCKVLVEAIVKSEHLVVYTGAGISTAACIPDYRGSNGIWTRLQQGKDIGKHDLSLAEPTITHMALAELYRKKILKYVVSQNCDGLHLRSGLPRTALSELHGNMYIEVCKKCKPVREYWRMFDVTENTARYSHKTMRRCYVCSGELTDTIVHFGERGTLQWPLNWPGACKNADTADTIICLGSSLKVLKKYPLLWQMNKPAKKRPNLFIVNLQWTPKDDCAILKINGKCDDVMKIIMKYLGIEIPPYNREMDPIFQHATVLNEQEAHTTSQPCLSAPQSHLTPTQSHLTPTQSHLRKTQSHLTPTQSHLTPTQTHLRETSHLRQTQSHLTPTQSHLTPTQSHLTPTHSTPFSIENILNTNQTSLQSTLMAAYYLNLQNILPPYFAGLYPYQTSLLYSGLHSIINPMPFINYGEAICEFCYKNNQTFCCGFYGKTEAVFREKIYRFSKKEQIKKELVCVCCDYTTDEDEGEPGESGESDADTKKQKIEKTEVTPENKIQAGWFGKGYKKNRKTRKKHLTPR